MKRFVFLDRDGVINVERGDYTITIDQWEWAPGAIEGVKLLTGAGFGIIVITNQSCIAKGLQTEEGLVKLHDFMINHIRKADGEILKIYHCPHRETDNCSCRKPEPGMILKAAEEFGINLAETFFIGDAERDIDAGRRARTRTILLENAGQDRNIRADFRAENLLDAARTVIRETITTRG